MSAGPGEVSSGPLSSLAGSFTEEEYAALLDKAKANYRFCHYEDLIPEAPCVVWRHDIDYSPWRALALARLEHERGLKAHYHVMLGNAYYNSAEPKTAQILRAIAALGHWIGLHFDMDVFGLSGNEISEETFSKRVVAERGMLEEILGQPVDCLSFHNVTLNAGRIHTARYLSGLLNVDAPEIKSRFDYVSDSNGIWRYRRLWDVLESAPVPRLQVLTHPVWWTPEPMSPYQRLVRAVEGRKDSCLGGYTDIMRRDGRLSQIAQQLGLPE